MSVLDVDQQFDEIIDHEFLNSIFKQDHWARHVWRTHIVYDDIKFLAVYCHETNTLRISGANYLLFPFVLRHTFTNIKTRSQIYFALSKKCAELFTPYNDEELFDMRKKYNVKYNYKAVKGYIIDINHLYLD